MRRSRRALTRVGVFPHTDPLVLSSTAGCACRAAARSPPLCHGARQPKPRLVLGLAGDLCAYARGRA